MEKLFIYIAPVLIFIGAAVILSFAAGFIKPLKFSRKKKETAPIDERTKKKMARNQARENVLEGTHIYLAKSLYNAIRYIFCAVLMLMTIVTMSPMGLFLTIIIFLFSVPERKFAGMTTPFGLILNLIQKDEILTKEEELYSSMSLLQNLITQHEHRPVGALYLIEFLKRDSTLTKLAYNRMIAKLQMNDRQGAIDAFSDTVGSPNAREFAKLLVNLDDVPPAQMRESLISRQDFMEQTSLTKAKKRAELGSDIMYIPILLTVMLIVVNMIYLCYFSSLVDIFTFNL